VVEVIVGNVCSGVQSNHSEQCEDKERRLKNTGGGISQSGAHKNGDCACGKKGGAKLGKPDR